MVNRWQCNDFNHYYTSSLMLSQGVNPYVTPLKPLMDLLKMYHDSGIPYATNPPPLIYLFMPFAQYDPLAAFNLWSTLQLLCFAANLYLVRKIINNKYFNSIFLEFTCLFAASFPVFLHFISAQVQFLILLFIYLAYLLFTQKKYALTFLLLATAGAIKIYPLFLAPWFLLRAQCTLSRKALHALLMVSWIAFLGYLTDLNLWRDFFQFSTPIIKNYIIGKGWNYGIPSFIGHLGVFFEFNKLFNSNIDKLTTTADVFGILALALCFIYILRNKLSLVTEFSLVLIFMLLATPSCWAHYVVAAMLPIAVIITNIHRNGSFSQKCALGLALFFLLIDVSVYATKSSMIAYFTCLHMPLFSMLALAYLLIRTDSPALHDTDCPHMPSFAKACAP